MMKKIEEINKEIKAVFQSATTEKYDERVKERDTVASKAWTQSIQKERNK